MSALDSNHIKQGSNSNIIQNNNLSNRPVFYTEDIFLLQKQKIQEIKQKQCDFELHEEDLTLYNKIFLFNEPNSLTKWEKSKINIQVLNEEETPIFQNCNYEQSNNENSNLEGIDIKDTVYISEEDLDYEISNIEIHTSITLCKESSFWLILRANKEIDEYSALIKVATSDHSQKVFISLGTFVKMQENEGLIFKVFSRQQLVSKSSSKKQKHIENDISSIRLIVNDIGEDVINVISYFNDGNEENKITCDFFLPLKLKRKIMFMGSGKETKIKSFKAICTTKPKFTEKGKAGKSNEQNCNCCTIV